MKIKLVADYNYKKPKGYGMEIDRIRKHPGVQGGYQVRVIGEWKNPEWFSIDWFAEEYKKGKK
jgi:hypothetical protein